MNLVVAAAPTTRAPAGRSAWVLHSERLADAANVGRERVGGWWAFGYVVWWNTVGHSAIAL